MFEDDPQAKTADLVGRVKTADPFIFENKLGGSSGLNLGETPMTRSQKAWRKKKESVRFGTFSRKGKANG